MMVFVLIDGYYLGLNNFFLVKIMLKLVHNSPVSGHVCCTDRTSSVPKFDFRLGFKRQNGENFDFCGFLVTERNFLTVFFLFVNILKY